MGANVQMKHVDSNGNTVTINPITKGANVNVTPNVNIPTASNVQGVVDNLGALAFEDGINSATTSTAGITQLSSSTTSTSESMAATPKAVSSVQNSVNDINTARQSDETLGGVKTLSAGSVIVGNSLIEVDEDTGDLTIGPVPTT